MHLESTKLWVDEFVRTVLPLAAPEERAGVLSTLYVVAYLAMGVPAVFAGFRVVHGGGVCWPEGSVDADRSSTMLGVGHASTGPTKSTA